jgi:hypothetical protein
MEKLVIKHLSKRGELLDCINCPAGKLTVLRAEQDSDLVPFRQALYGSVSGQKLSIYLDETPFNPSDCTYIGFSNWIKGDGHKLVEVLLEYGISEGQLDSICSAYGITDALERDWKDITDDYRRRVELILASYSASKILVLDSPFEPIPHIWKDRFAELIMADVKSQRRITIFSRLCYRPESWVGNDLINRVQVGSSVKRTIGYGQEASDFNKLVKELRQNVTSDSAPSLSESAPIGAVFQSTNKSKTTLVGAAPFWKVRRNQVAIGLCSVLVISAGTYIAFRPTPQPTVVAEKNTPVIAPVVLPQNQVAKIEVAVVQVAMEGTKNSPDKVNEMVVKEVAVPPVPPVDLRPAVKEPVKTPPKTSIDGYSAEIQRAIIEAFNEKDISSGVTKVGYKPAPSTKTADDDDNPFRAISKLSPSKDNGSSYNSDNSYTSDYNSNPAVDSDFAARQEEIRRRFLEALQRANNN